MKILFFGSLREQLGTGEIELPLAPGTKNVADLLEALKRRGPEWQRALSTDSLLYAVNQIIAAHDTLLEDSDEVALFPPVTGG
ncbi:molybdopterin converting factor subunit 1 [Porticoccus sp.]|uniref:molybdopterin converting factor subunit 1 n=1 Tax=Porticoccus sp. TaxID=2024853 RepID=UPI003F696120